MVNDARRMTKKSNEFDPKSINCSPEAPEPRLETLEILKTQGFRVLGFRGLGFKGLGVEV